METLENKSKLEILNIIKVIVSTINSYEDVDPMYGLDFSIKECGYNWAVKYTWARGEYSYLYDHKNIVDRLLMDKGGFIINKDIAIKELIEKIKDAIDAVTLNLYDPETEK
jgi:hypothetical protein